MLKQDMPLFQVVDFEKFDRGENISQHIEGEHELQPGDTLRWEAGSNLSGFAEVISAVEPRNGWTYVTFKKK